MSSRNASYRDCSGCGSRKKITAIDLSSLIFSHGQATPPRRPRFITDVVTLLRAPPEQSIGPQYKARQTTPLFRDVGDMTGNPEVNFPVADHSGTKGTVAEPGITEGKQK